MTKPIRLGVSPCPNDTFIFASWINGQLSPQDDVPIEAVEYCDIETLNEKAFRGEFDVVKVSFHAVGALLDRYVLLGSGGALGRDCGPLVVARDELDRTELVSKTIAIPGRWTTAALLMKLWVPEASNLRVMPFHEIMPAVEAGTVDAGLIIHESRFTYPDHGLKKVVDLGEWWEASTGFPIPLGGIMVRRDLDPIHQRKIESAIRASLTQARRGHWAGLEAYMAEHAQEMDRSVRRRHIDLYVNDFSVDYGPEGRQAIEHLIGTARTLNLIQDTDLSLFVAE